MGLLMSCLQPFKWTFRVLFILANNLYCIPTYMIWLMIVHPLYYINPQLYWRIEGEFFQWLLTCVGFWTYSAGYYIVESGDSIDNILDDVTLIIANHQSTADVPLLIYNFSAKTNMLRGLSWIMDIMFKYTNFGLVSTLHGDFFISSGRDSRDTTLIDLENYLRDTFSQRGRKSLVLFPEGGFLHKRREASNRYAEKIGLPSLEHVTLPRLGAFRKTIDTLAPLTEEGIVGQSAGRLKYVVDMTIAYPGADPIDVINIILGNRPSCKIQIHSNVYPIEEVPHQTEQELQKWLYDIYIKKNAVLEQYYATGIFPADKTRWAPTDGSPAGVSNYLPLRPADSELISSNTELPEGDNMVQPKQSSKEKSIIHEPMTSEEESREDENNYLRMDLVRVALIHTMFISSSLFHWAVIDYFYRIFRGD